MFDDFYRSGAASLFAVHARSRQEDRSVKAAVCPKCMSDDISVVDNERGIFECDHCGKIFTRETR